MGNGAALFAPVLAPILDSTCRVESHSTLIAWWGGPLGPRGTPSPRFSPDGSTLAPPRQADGGVGRGPGGPPHQARRSRDSAQLFMQFRGPKAHPDRKS